MDHKLFRSKISEYMDKKLSANELAKFDEHAKACPECLLELQMTVKAVKELKRSPRAKEQELPVNFYAKLGQKLDAADTEKQKRKSFVYMPWFRAAAMSFALIMIAVMVRQITKSPEFMGNRGFSKSESMMAEQKTDIQSDNSGKIEDQERNEEPVIAGFTQAPEPAPAVAQKRKSFSLSKAAGGQSAAKAEASKPAAKEAEKKEAIEDKIVVKSVDIIIPEENMYDVAEAPVKMQYNYGAPITSEKIYMEYRPDLKQQPSLGVSLGKDDSTFGMSGDKIESKVSYAFNKFEPKKDFSGTKSGVEVFQALAFTKGETWRQFMIKYPVLDTVTVDFNTEMIVSVFLGTKPTAGYNVMITDVFYESDKVLVKYIETIPNKGTLQAQVITTPYSMKVVKKSSLRVEFERQ